MSTPATTAGVRKARRISLVAVLVLGLAAVGCLATAAALHGQVWRLHTQGVTAQAYITNKTVERHWRRNGHSVDYYLRYQFRPAGETAHVRARRAVSRQFYKATAKGRPVPVRYLPQDPSVNEIEPGTRGANAWIAAGFGAGFAALALFVLLAPASQLLRRTATKPPGGAERPTSLGKERT